MSTKIYNSNTACCSIPPVQSSYQPQGTTKPYVGFNKAYVTGPDGTGRALIGIYDIFGFYPQTLQGADILAKTLDAKVILPDFFEPNAPFAAEDYPPDTDDKKARLQAFFGGPADIKKAVANVKKVGKLLKDEGYAKIVVYGFCWGGKVATLVGDDKDFNAVAAIHPAMMDANDAKNLIIPIALFPSKDEPKDVFEKIVNEISGKPFAAKNAYKLYDTVHHGWAAARANLEDPENKKQYEDVYGRLSGFYKGVWA